MQEERLIQIQLRAALFAEKNGADSITIHLTRGSEDISKMKI